MGGGEQDKNYKICNVLGGLDVTVRWSDSLIDNHANYIHSFFLVHLFLTHTIHMLYLYSAI